MDNDKTIAANFSEIPQCYDLVTSVNPALSGDIAVSPSPNCDGNQYTEGTQLSLVATAETDFSFFEWSGDVNGSTSSTTLLMDSNKNITAHFTTEPPPDSSIVNAGSGSVAPSGSIVIPVSALNVPPLGLGAANVRVQYDSAVLDAVSCTVPGSGFCNPDFNSNTVAFNFTNLTGVSGDFVLAEITFQAIGQSGSSSALNPTVTNFVDPSGNALPTTVEGGTVTVGLTGNVDCNTARNATDGLFILQYDVGLRGSSTQCPLPENTLYEPGCDTNQDGACNATDALFVLQCDVGLSNSLCPADPLHTPPFVSEAETISPTKTDAVRMTNGLMEVTGVDGDVTIGGGSVVPGDSIEVLINANLAADANLGSGTIEIHYDPTVVDAIACTSDPDNVFDMGICNLNYDNDGIAPDIVRFNMISTQGAPGNIDLARITFQAVGQDGDSANMEGMLVTFSDPAGNQLDVAVVNGLINIQEVPTEQGILSISPPAATMHVGEIITVTAVISDITALAGIDLELTFDPAIVEVVDANSTVNGVQISPGDCPIPGQTVENSADNSTGTISYSTATMAPNPACNGDGVVMSITFRGRAVGNSAIAFSSWDLSDANGLPISTNTPQDGSLTVLDSGSIVGMVELQGRTDFSDVIMTASDGTTTVSTTTDANGNYALAVPSGTYVVTAEMERYLDSELSNVVVVTGSDTNLTDLWLPGGDANDDDVINILDMSLIGSHYELSCGDAGWDGRADTNDNCTVNIYDLTIAAGNFGQVSPVAWPQ